MIQVMTMAQVEELFPQDVELAYAIIDRVCDEQQCMWYEAIEDFGAYELMEESGVREDVIAAICYEI
jgi:hypothetical protein